MALTIVEAVHVKKIGVPKSPAPKYHVRACQSFKFASYFRAKRPGDTVFRCSNVVLASVLAPRTNKLRAQGRHHIITLRYQNTT